jgi:hypothetical protein
VNAIKILKTMEKSLRELLSLLSGEGIEHHPQGKESELRKSWRSVDSTAGRAEEEQSVEEDRR